VFLFEALVLVIEADTAATTRLQVFQENSFISKVCNSDKTIHFGLKMIVHSAGAHNMMSHFRGSNEIITNDVFLFARRKMSKERKEQGKGSGSA